MARYRKIDPRIWNDAKFSSLSHEAQRMFFFVLTHPAMTSLGAFRISQSGMAEELGLAGKGFAEPVGELFRKGLINYDERAFLLFVPNFLKYNQPENPNVVKGWKSAIDLLPECDLKLNVLAKAKACTANNDALSKAFDNAFGSVTERVTETLSEGLPKPLSKGMPNQEQEQEYKKEVKEKGAAMTHRLALQAIPSEWKTYANKVRPDLNAEREFADFVFYFTQGKGSSKLRSDKGWSQAWQGWVRRAKEQTQQKPVSTSSFFAVPKPEPKRSFDDETEQADDFDLSAFGVAK